MASSQLETRVKRYNGIDYDDLLIVTSYNKLLDVPSTFPPSSHNHDTRYVRFDTASQGLTDTQKSNARTNIGAGTSNFTGYTSSDKLSAAYISGLAAVATSGSYNDLSNKPTIYTDCVRYVSQSLTDTQKTQARSNIGAGTYSKPSGGIPASDLAQSYYLASNPNGYTSNIGTVTSVNNVSPSSGNVTINSDNIMVGDELPTGYEESSITTAIYGLSNRIDNKVDSNAFLDDFMSSAASVATGTMLIVDGNGNFSWIDYAPSAAQGGTYLSLVTTGEKYTWNNKGTVTSVAVKMNGSVKGTVTTSGTIDLGTVITSHQDISGKLDKSGGTMTGHITFNHGYNIRSKNAAGSSTGNIFYINNNNMLVMGDNGVWNYIYFKNTLYPDSNNVYSLGSSSTKWKEVHATTIYENGTSLADKYLGINAVSDWAKASTKPSYAFSEITSRYESYLGWGGGESKIGAFGPLDACLVSKLGANRVAGIDGAAITIERSNDSGSTWSTVSTSTYTKAQRKSLFTTSAPIELKYGSINQVTDRLRITMNATDYSVYSTIQKIMMLVSTNGSSGCQVFIETAYYGSPTTWHTVGTYGLSGWSGWNVMNLTLPGSSALGGANSSTHNKFIRFTFSCSGVDSTYTGGLNVYSIYMFGGVGWTTPSTLAKEGVPYSYDEEGDVTFPKYVNAPVIRPTTCILLQNTASYLSGIYYHAASNESVVFANKYNVTSWIFANADPTEKPDWQTLTPALQIKNQRVAINKLIAAGANANYQLDVNGSIGGTTIYENGTAIDTIMDNKIQAAIGDAIAASY